MTTTLYAGTVFGSKHGEFLGSFKTFDIDTFNAYYIQNYEMNYYCKCNNFKVDFENLSKKELSDILSKYGIIVYECKSTDFKKTLDKIYVDYPNFTKFDENDFEILTKDEFIEKLEISKKRIINITPVYKQLN